MNIPKKLPKNTIPAKIIAIDLDDTLLKDDLSISQNTINILQKAAEKEIYIVLCSGRTENAILPYVRQLDLAGTEFGRYIIASNGAIIADLHTRREIYARTVDPELLIYAYKEASKEGLFCEVYDPATIYTPKDNKWAQVDVKLSGLKMSVVHDFKSFLRKGHPKMVVPGEPNQILALHNKLKAAIGNKCVIFTSKPYFLEILPSNCGKGESLEWLCMRLNIERDNAVSFGDSMNDESMTRYAKHSVAMTNGLDTIKTLASYTTEHTNNNDGLALFVEKFIL